MIFSNLCSFSNTIILIVRNKCRFYHVVFQCFMATTPTISLTTRLISVMSKMILRDELNTIFKECCLEICPVDRMASNHSALQPHVLITNYSPVRKLVS